MYDIFYIAKEKDINFVDIQKRFPLIKLAKYDNDKGEAFFSAQKKTMSKFFWIIDEGFEINKDFNFDYEVSEWDEKYVHVFRQNNELYGGIYLIPRKYNITKKEAEYNFFINKKDIDINVGVYPPFEQFTIKKPEDYFEAQQKCKTSMFYAIEKDSVLISDFSFDIPAWDQKYVHTFKGGVNLIPKNYPITKKEAEYSFFVNKKEVDIFAGKILYDRFIIEKPEDYFEAQQKCKTSMFYAIDKDYAIIDNLEFVVPNYDKNYVHIFKNNNDEYKGLCLIPKEYPITKKESEYSFFVNKKEVDIVGCRINYDKFIIKNSEDYFEAQQKCKTSMFYAIDKDYAIIDNLEFVVPNYDKNYVHIFKNNNDEYKGLCLIPKEYPITKKEAEYNFFVNKKEVDIVGCRINYDKFIIKNSEDYFEAQQKCKTSMFYAIDKDYKITFNFDYIVPDYEKMYVNVFKTHEESYGEISLIPKEYVITKKEADYKFFINKKEIDIDAGKLNFDIVFISYNEPNADENYEKLKERFPTAKRVDKVKGIHQAHIEAAKIVETSMFWAIDGDAIIEDNFDFYLNVPKWDRDAVHVFRSKNPINGLVYGYGGVKLLPTKLVLDMNINSIDMTTSISKKFISIDQVSNITAFNTDPFNTWKSAFRECVKLSSKIIDGQVDEETQHRLDVWCSIGLDKEFGNYAIKGAKYGCKFGTEFSNDKEQISKINDWKWLEEKFKEDTMSGLFSRTVKNIKGESIDLSALNDKVVLVVNTASMCGLTPQFSDLEKLYQDYKDKGLEVIGFPSNNFADQEPKSNSEILEFCQKDYNVTFPLMEKIDVLEGNVDPLYVELHNRTGAKPEWNFSRYLVNKGSNVAYFAPTSSYDDLRSAIDAIL